MYALPIELPLKCDKGGERPAGVRPGPILVLYDEL